MFRLIKFILSLFDYFTEKKILTQLKETLKEKKTISVIDIGSHKGEFISGINRNFVINKAYCFEPNPSSKDAPEPDIVFASVLPPRCPA